MTAPRPLASLLLLAIAACAPAAAPPRPTNVAIARATPAPAAAPASIDPAAACSTSATRIVTSLRSPLHLVAYVTRGSKDGSSFAAALGDVLQQLKATSRQVTFDILDAAEPQHAAAAKEAGLIAREEGYSGLVIAYEGRRESIKTFGSERQGLAFWVNNKVLETVRLAHGTQVAIGLLTGHEELALSGEHLVPPDQGHVNLQKIITQYFPQYRFVDVDLKRGAAAVDAELAGLVVTQPGEDLNDQELHRIDDFVLAGKTLAIVASAVNIKAGDTTMHATLSAHGLDRLLAGYGIELRKDVVTDFGRSFRVELMTTSSPSPMTARFPAILDVLDDERFTGTEQLLDTGFVPFFRIGELQFPFSSFLALHAERQPAATLRVLARSTPKANRLQSAEIDLSITRKWSVDGITFAQHAVAAVASGKLRSAFSSAQTSRGDARVLAIASAQFFANPFVRAGGGKDAALTPLAMPYAQQVLTNSILVAKNTLDWIGMDADLEACARLR